MLQTTGSSRAGTALQQVSASSGDCRASDLTALLSSCICVALQPGRSSPLAVKEEPTCPEHLILCAVLQKEGD